MMDERIFSKWVEMNSIQNILQSLIHWGKKYCDGQLRSYELKN